MFLTRCSTKRSKSKLRRIEGPALALLAAALIFPVATNGLANESGDVETESADSGLIVPDRFLTVFSFRGEQRRVFVTRSFKTAHDADVDQRKLFRRSKFYVLPSADLTRAELDAALQASHDSEGDTAPGKLRLRLHLIDEGVREAAAAQINRDYGFDGVVHPDQIHVVRYRYLEADAMRDGREVLLASLPSGEQRWMNPEMQFGPLPEYIDVEVRGTHEELASLDREWTLGLRFTTTGLSLRENIVDYGLGRIVDLGLHHALTGESEWSDGVISRSTSGGASIGFLGIKLGGSSKSAGVTNTKHSWVTRNQVRRVVTEAHSALGLRVWVDPGAGPIDDLQRQFLSNLLTVAEDREVDIVREGTEFVIDPKLREDLAPDRYTALNDSVKSMIALESGDSAGRRSGSRGPSLGPRLPSRAPASPKTGSSGAAPSYRDENDISWKREGAIWVPKSVRLYQYNESSFRSLAQRRFTWSTASTRTQLQWDRVRVVDEVAHEPGVSMEVLGRNVGTFGVVRNAPPNMTIGIYYDNTTANPADDRLMISGNLGSREAILAKLEDTFEKAVERARASTAEFRKLARNDPRFLDHVRTAEGNERSVRQQLASVQGDAFPLRRQGTVDGRRDKCFLILGVPRDGWAIQLRGSDGRVLAEAR